MKIIFQVSSFLHKTRRYVLLSACSVFFLISCNLRENIEHVYISTEGFIPHGLCEKSRLFCFSSDSLGYALSIKDTLIKGIEKEWTIVSHTRDRGRTWVKCGEIDGFGTSISKPLSNVFFSTKKQSGDECISEIWKLNATNCQLENIAHINDEIFGFHAFDDTTYTYFPYNGGHITDFYFSNDSGKHWQKKTMPGTAAGINYCSYSRNELFCTIFGSDLFDNKLYIFDIVQQMERCIRIGNAQDVVASDSLLVFAHKMAFYHYSDETLTYISCFNWNHRFGRYFPLYLNDSNGIIICSGSEFYAKSGRHNCIFYSTDSGSKWKRVIMEDNIMQNNLGFNENAMTNIPTKDGTSILYQRYEDNMLHIINIKKKEIK